MKQIDESVMDKVNDWLMGGERGISSEAIVSKITGINICGQWGLEPPSDPSDFNRCYKLLIAVPEFKDMLDIMKTVSQTWSNLVDNWDELEALLLEELPNGTAPKLYERMRELRG